MKNRLRKNRGTSKSKVQVVEIKEKWEAYIENNVNKIKTAHGAWKFEVGRRFESLVGYGVDWKNSMHEKRQLEVTYFYKVISYFGKYPL